MGGKGLKNSICMLQIPLLSKSLLKWEKKERKKKTKPLYPLGELARSWEKIACSWWVKS